MRWRLHLPLDGLVLFRSRIPMPVTTPVGVVERQMHQRNWLLDICPYHQHPDRLGVDRPALDDSLKSTTQDEPESHCDWLL